MNPLTGKLWLLPHRLRAAVKKPGPCMAEPTCWVQSGWRPFLLALGIGFQGMKRVSTESTNRTSYCSDLPKWAGTEEFLNRPEGRRRQNRNRRGLPDRLYPRGLEERVGNFDARAQTSCPGTPTGRAGKETRAGQDRLTQQPQSVQLRAHSICDPPRKRA